MMGVLTMSPVRAALHRAARFMDVILHIGAHRTASTTLQHYLRSNAGALRAQGVGFWGPMRTRQAGLLSGVMPVPGGDPGAQLDRARGRIALQLETAARKGVRHVIISDENILGSVRRNLRQRRFYRDAGARLARFATAFDGRVTRIVLAVRRLDAFWASSLSYGVMRGRAVPGTDDLDRFVTQGRSWRTLVDEIATAFPGVGIQVHVHEELAGRPERRLWHMLDGAVTGPRETRPPWLNRASDLPALREVLALRGEDPALLPSGAGRWSPFDDAQAAALREIHADDLFHLASGAGGAVRLIKESTLQTGGMNPPDGAKTRGQDDDGQDGRMAQTG